MKCQLAIAMLIASSTLYANTDDCCSPLGNFFSCGGWSYQIRAGVYPTIWHSRGDIFLNGCDCTTNAVVPGTNLGEVPKFSKLFKVPFIVGSIWEMQWCDCFDLYGELNFIQASPRKEVRNTQQAANAAFALRLGHYRAVSGYVGLHYNLFECGASRVFLGAKLGAIYHSNIDAHQLVTSPDTNCACDQPFKRTFFKNKVKVSGGVNLSWDYCWCDCWGLVLTGEVVASGGPRGTCLPLTANEISQLAGGSALATHKIKTEISFPVTLGLRYNF